MPVSLFWARQGLRVGPAAAVVAALSACAVPRPLEPAAGPAVHDSLAVSPETSRLAEQAARDVDQLLQLTAAADEPSRPGIEWIRPAPPPPATGPPSDPVPQEPLAQDPPPRPAAEVPETEQPGRASAEVAQPGDESAEADRLRRLVVELSSELYRQGAYSDTPMRELILIAATTLVTPDRALATDALPGVTERERELLAELQSFFARLGRQLGESGDPEVIVAEVDALHQALVTQPRLDLPYAALCSRVRGFGDFDEFPRNHDGRYAFLALTGQQAVVYLEIEDFASELNEKGQWVTELSQQIVVYSESDGIPVWREGWQAGVDVSKNRREDFFIVQLITLPERLSVGLYDLKIRIRDERSGAEAETAIALEMVADPRLVGGMGGG